ncbi:MAG: hypothetical protein E6Q59_10810 [Nitrosomonas sp.]|nr:MAG: hypothetical protein E6Q59_10810 [Nitrosomonas sp.]
MTLDISKLLVAHRFVWETNSLGKVLVHNITSSADSNLRKAIRSYIDTDSKVFVKSLITNVCQLDSNNSGEFTHERVTFEQVDKFTDEELNEFACKFLEKNAYLKNDYSKDSSKRKKNEDGSLVVTIEYEKRDDARKLEDETYCDLLKRLMHYYRNDQDERTKKLYDSLKPKNIFSDSLLGLISENRKLSNSFESENHKFISSPKLYVPPENPVHKTNRQLMELSEEMGKTSGLIKNMNDVGMRMALEMALNNQRAGRYNNILIIIGIATLAFSAVMSYFSYVSSNEATRITHDILMKVNIALETAAIEQTKDNELVYLQLFKINETLSKLKEEHEISAKQSKKPNDK